jgi:hypothetical protein
MSGSVTVGLRSRNPDVLTCIANLSNDEVFTPPDFANEMLDRLEAAWAADNNGAVIWENPNLRFLDPFTKSGVFLREITTRLVEGLTAAIPDHEKRVEHILTRQVFGIAITHLTALLARRSLYCSKSANGPHSIVGSFESTHGNVWFEPLTHTWVSGRCTYCGASRASLDRSEDLESHAYAFIHADNINARISELFGENMHFDVIIGNPPYQLNTDGHGHQARPIYQKFVEQSLKLRPRYLSMVIPARWFSGGMGLDEFRATMLRDDRIRELHDFPDSNDVFPGTQIKGGVCYFLWNADNPGPVLVTTHDKGEVVSTAVRPLLEPGADVFIRFNEAIPILRKIFKVENSGPDSFAIPPGRQFSSLVSSIGAFGLDTTFKGKDSRGKTDLKVYRNGGVGFIERDEIAKELHVIDKWKVFIPRAGSGSDSFPHPILGRPFIGEPGSISSWTYMHIGPFASEEESKNVVSYIQTRLFRFLVLLHKPTQDATKAVYTFVPTQDWSRGWTDLDLYKKYDITDEEIAYIESLIRPMSDDD